MSKLVFLVKVRRSRIKYIPSSISMLEQNGSHVRIQRTHYGFLKNPKVYPGCEVFVPFEDKVPFLDRLASGVNFGLDRILQITTLGTATLTTIFLVKNINN